MATGDSDGRLARSPSFCETHLARFLRRPPLALRLDGRVDGTTPTHAAHIARTTRLRLLTLDATAPQHQIHFYLVFVNLCLASASSLSSYLAVETCRCSRAWPSLSASQKRPVPVCATNDSRRQAESRVSLAVQFPVVFSLVTSRCVFPSQAIAADTRCLKGFGNNFSHVKRKRQPGNASELS